MKTSFEQILKGFLKNYNNVLENADKGYKLDYKVYIQKIDTDKEDIQVDCTVFELLRIKPDEKAVILYEGYMKNEYSPLMSIKEKLISKFVIEGLTTIVGALEEIQLSKDGKD